jgi:glycerophosphoryl diester phosphodiesterase
MAEVSSTLNIAHRGARSLAPENTLASARKALEIGADMWELDVCMTADGQLLILHDDTLERTSNARQVFPDRSPWNVSDFTLEEIRSLDFGSWFNEQDPFRQIAAGKVSTQEQQSYVGEPAPTLQEALEFTRDNNWRVNVEIKDLTGQPGDASVVEKVIDLIEELNMEDRVLISSFNPQYVQRSRIADANISAAILVSEGDPDPAALVNRLQAQAYNPKLGSIRMDEVRSLRTQGIGVNVWTVNDPKQMQALIEAGASGIFTDFPQVLKTLLLKE